MESLESFGIVGKFWDSLESFRTAWKVARQSGKFSEIRKVSGQSEKFVDSLKSFEIVWKVLG